MLLPAHHLFAWCLSYQSYQCSKPFLVVGLSISVATTAARFAGLLGKVSFTRSTVRFLYVREENVEELVLGSSLISSALFWASTSFWQSDCSFALARCLLLSNFHFNLLAVSPSFCFSVSSSAFRWFDSSSFFRRSRFWLLFFSLFSL